MSKYITFLCDKHFYNEFIDYMHRTSRNDTKRISEFIVAAIAEAIKKETSTRLPISGRDNLL